jgi:hypothetical protein
LKLERMRPLLKAFYSEEIEQELDSLGLKLSHFAYRRGYRRTSAVEAV